MDHKTAAEFANVRLCCYEGPEKEEFINHIKKLGERYTRFVHMDVASDHKHVYQQQRSE